MKRVRVLLIFILGFVLISCKSKEENKTLQFESDSLLQTRYTKLLRYNIDSISFPRSYSHTNGTIKKVSSSDWTSGFFPGNLWQLYGLTGIETFKNKAINVSNFLVDIFSLTYRFLLSVGLSNSCGCCHPCL